MTGSKKTDLDTLQCIQYYLVSSKKTDLDTLQLIQYYLVSVLRKLSWKCYRFPSLVSTEVCLNQFS
jgi:hypothetical protein